MEDDVGQSCPAGLADEERWDQALTESGVNLEQLADEALAEYRSGLASFVRDTDRL